MRWHWLVGALLGMAIALGGGVVLAPPVASACRLIDVPGGARNQRLQFALDVVQEPGSHSGPPPVVLVGEVTSEVRVEFVDGASPFERAYVLSNESEPSSGDFGYYRSLVKPLAVLYGDWPGGSIEMFLQENPECFGGPRLKDGERVLLVLVPTLIAYGWYGELWELQPLPIGGKVVFRDGQAYLNDLYRPGRYEPLGDADTLIREVSTELGMSPRSESLALAALRSDGGDPAGFILTAVLGGTVLTLSLGAALVSFRR